MAAALPARAQRPPVPEAEPPPSASPEVSARAEAATADDVRARLARLESELAELRARPASTAPEAPLLQPTLLGELDYRVYPSAIEGNTGFALGRLRPGLVLAPARWLRAVAAFEFAGESPIVLDAYARLRAADWVEFTAGYSKPPLFASFIYEPVHAMPFPDRAPVLTAFRVRRDLGVDVHLSPRTLPLECWLRVGNGTGSALGNDNALPAGYGAVDLVLGRAWAGAPAERRRFGLRLGGAALVESPRDRDGINGKTPFGFVYFRPKVVSGLRVVGQGHVIGYAGPVRLTVEGAVAREERSRDDDGNPSTPRVRLPTVRSYGVTAEVAWAVLGQAREVGRAPGGELGPWRGGALELAARYDGMWLGRGAGDVQPGGSQGGALAIKWWPTGFLAASVAGYLTRYDTPPIEAPNDRWSWGAMARLSFFWGLPGRPQRAQTPATAR